MTQLYQLIYLLQFIRLVEIFMPETISAQKARLNFGEMLNDVYYRKRVFTIARKGKPMAKLVPTETSGESVEDKTKVWMKYFGILDPEKGERMKKLIYEARKTSARPIPKL